jgi:hypothetical protein
MPPLLQKLLWLIVLGSAAPVAAGAAPVPGQLPRGRGEGRGTVTCTVSGAEDNWGHFHETGHNDQQDAWTFEGAGEVTVNIFTLYNFPSLQEVAIDAHDNFWRGVEKTRPYLERGARFPDWQADPELALVTYALIARQRSWGFTLRAEDRKAVQGLEPWTLQLPVGRPAR